MTSATLTGLTAGTWTIDPTHSTVGFSVRHLVVSKVRGTFGVFSGQVVVEPDGTAALQADVVVGSFTTGNGQRDAHVRSADFLEATTHPHMTYRSTSVEPLGSTFTVHGELTLRGVTHPVDLAVEFNGVSAGMGAGPVAGFEATASINRRDFGIVISMPMEGGVGAVVGDTIAITLAIEATRG